MTTDNQKKYEEAAKAHIESLMGIPAVGMNIGYQTYSGALYPCFLAGASFAKKEQERFQSEYDKMMLAELEDVKKEAHNAAIDKALEMLRRKVEFGVIEKSWEHIREELEELKL